MRWIVGTSIRARRFVAALAVGLIVFGVVQLRHMPVDVLPEFSPPTVEVQTEALGLSAPEVEQLITVPLEQDLLDGVAWLDTIRSESIPGLSRIEMIFEPGTDILRARQVVQERLSQAAGLPNVSLPPQMIQPLSSTGRIMMVRLSSDQLSPIQMSVLARWTIRPRLLGVPGVANVSIWGQRERQLQVRVDPGRLRNQGLSLQNVIETTGNALWASPLSFLEASTPGTGGFIDTANQRLSIQHLQPITTARELAEVPIEERNGTVVRLSDVAQVVEDHQPLIGDAVFTDGPGLLLVIEKLPGSNTLEVSRGVEDALDLLRPGLAGMQIDSNVFRPADFIERSMRNVAVLIGIGLLLALLTLFAFLFSWRTSLVVAAAVTLSFTVAAIVLFLAGATLNAMALAGLVMALAVVIGDGVGDVENVMRRLRQRRPDNGDSASPLQTIVAASLEMRSALAFATLIVLVTLLPMFFLQERAGAFAPSIVLTYGLAIVASMVVALVATPALGALLLAGDHGERRVSPLERRLQRGYERAIGGALGKPRRVYLAAGVILLVGAVTIPFFGETLMPSLRDGDVLVQWDTMPGTSLPEMDRITSRVGQELRAVPGVADVGAHVGRAILSDQAAGVDTGQLWVSIDPSADYDATLAAIRGVIDGYPGIVHHVSTYSDERIGQVIAPTDPPVVVRVFGQDLGVLRAKAAEIEADLGQIDGVVNPRTSLQVQDPTVRVEVDLAAARRYGIKPGDVRRAAATLLSGTGVGSLFEEQKVFDVVVWGTPRVRNSLSSVDDLLIDTPGGGHVRLGQVADVSIEPTPSVIEHEDVSRSMDVRADVSGRDVGAVLDDVRSKLDGVRFPLEYHAELVGNYEARHAAARRLFAVAIAAAILAFLLLQAAFGSWRLATLAFLLVPTALAGGLIAAFIDGRTVSLGTIVGLIAVLGIAAREAVVLFRHYGRLGAEGGTPFGPGLVSLGSRERLMPTVITATTTIVALLPLVIAGGGAAGAEILHPMAVVMLGGLITSALLTLFVMPVLYLRVGPAPTAEADRPQVVVVPDVEPVRGG